MNADDAVKWDVYLATRYALIMAYGYSRVPPSSVCDDYEDLRAVDAAWGRPRDKYAPCDCAARDA